MSNYDYDLCILGSGPGGYVAAIKAGQEGLKVAIIEVQDVVGGTCLNTGCIPTKALLHCAELYHDMKNSQDIGITSVGGIRYDLKKIVEHAENTVKKLNFGVAMLLKKNKVTFYNGFGSFIDRNNIEIKEKNGKISKISFKNAIIATGASARQLPIFPIDEDIICTYKGALKPNIIPERLTIIGGGVIGLEFANFYVVMGSKVTVIEAMEDILMTEDKEIRQKVKKSFEKLGIEIITKAIVQKLVIGKKDTKIFLEKDGEINELLADKVIVAIGIAPNVKNIGLETLGIVQEKSGHIKINDYCQTNIDNIYAIGDVVRGPWLAHKASHEGIIAVENIKGKNKKMHYNAIPSCIYTFPQIAHVGLSEEEAKNKGLDIRVGRFYSVGNGKCIASEDNDAFIKTIFDKKTGEILGVHIIGKNATEIIHSATIAMNSELVDEDFMSAIFPHPTMSEMLHESVLDSHNKAIHG